MKALMTTTGMLLRRELWEHKTAAIWTPVVIASALILFLVIGSIYVAAHLDSDSVEWLNGVEESEVQSAPSSDDEQQTLVLDFSAGEIVISDQELTNFNRDKAEPALAFRAVLQEIGLGFRFLALIVAIFYLMNALYADRKDRSILFWKSLPFGESTGVAAKLLTGTFVIPLIAFAAALAVQLVAAVLMTLFYTLAASYSLGDIFGQVGFLQIFFTQLGLLLATGIKLLPLFSLLLLSSAAATRSPLGLIVVPPMVLIAVEFFLFNTTYVARTLGYLFLSDLVFWGEAFGEMGELTGRFRAMLMITPWQIAKAILVSAPLLFAAVWFRNNRYEI